MTIEIKVPPLPESVADATVAAVHFSQQTNVNRDQNLFDLETDKVMIEVPAPANGLLKEIKVKAGDIVTSGTLLVILEEGEAAASESSQKKLNNTDEKDAKPKGVDADTDKHDNIDAKVSPVVRRLMTENQLQASDITSTGKDGRITKSDVERALSENKSTDLTHEVAQLTKTGRIEERVPMTRLRARIAERLLDAKRNTAMLTTFNEIDMHEVMKLRKKYKDIFAKENNIKLGFMSFFVKAVIAALQKFPEVNASIDGKDIIYHNFQDIGIAVGTDRGLVVPIVRDAQTLSMADIEKSIRDFAIKAQEAKLTIEEMTGGTFTITNGGTFGSMLSTPILNPPQSAILGMHNIVERAVVVNGEIKVRPIMYVALSYDHRIIDGSVSVQFLRAIKESLEDPARMILSL